MVLKLSRKLGVRSALGWMIHTYDNRNSPGFLPCNWVLYLNTIKIPLEHYPGLEEKVNAVLYSTPYPHVKRIQLFYIEYLLC